MALRTISSLSRFVPGHSAIRQSCPSLRVHSPPSTSFPRFASSASDIIPWHERLPLTLRPSFWKSLIPRPLRRTSRKENSKPKPRRGIRQENPATYFILMFMLIGSFGIHYISLRHQYAYSSRQAENRIAMLQEVLKRVQAGEDLDVEKMLGTGDPLAEQEWEEVIKNIEEEDRLWQSKERKKARKQARKEAREAAEAAMAAENPSRDSDPFAKMTNDFKDNDEQTSRKKRVPGFY